MANTKISSLTTLTSVPADDDFHMIVDKSDTSMAVTGTNKQIQEKFYFRTNGTANTLSDNIVAAGKSITGAGTVSGALASFTTHQLGTFSNYKAYNDTAVSIIDFDTNDRIRYNQTSNQFEFMIGNNVIGWLGGNLGIMSAVPLTESVVGVTRVSAGVAGSWAEILFEQSSQIRNIGLNNGVLYFYKPGTALLLLDGNGNLDLVLGNLTLSGGGRIGEAWANISFNTGWENYGSGEQVCQIKRAGDLVFLRGMCKRSSGAETVISGIPAGYGPKGYSRFTAPTNTTSAGEVHISADTGSGSFIISAVGGTGYVCLDGIVFSRI